MNPRTPGEFIYRCVREGFRRGRRDFTWDEVMLAHRTAWKLNLHGYRWRVIRGILWIIGDAVTAASIGLNTALLAQKDMEAVLMVIAGLGVLAWSKKLKKR